MIEIHTQAKPSRTKNDDIAGYEGRTFWLMDGATQLIQPEHGLDAAWHVGALDKAFLTTLKKTPNIELSALARNAMIEVSSEFEKVSGLSAADPQELRPFSTLVLCRAAEDRTSLDYLIVCDSTLAVIGPSGETVISDTRIALTDPLAGAYALLREGHDFSSDIFKQEMRELYKRTFSRINGCAPDDFDVIGQDHSVIDRALQGTLPISSQDHILLMSDGFTRGVDTLNLYQSWSDVVDNLQRYGGEAVLNNIRNAERGDSNGKNHPRSSIHDDATLLWIRPRSP